MSPEEKMAARILARHKLQPPYNLKSLVENYAEIEIIEFPIKADGVTIGVGEPAVEKPTILINSAIPEARRKFTLAHELGHIIIPWHNGTIVSHLDLDGDDYEYKEMESEANRFAAELLIPSEWLLAEHAKSSSFPEFIKGITKATGASRDAVMIKVFNTINAPVICIQVDYRNTILAEHHTSTAPRMPSLHGVDIWNDEIFQSEHIIEEFKLGDRTYICWCFSDKEIIETDPRPWRDILKQITDETDSSDIIKNINAILPASFQKHKNLTEPEICSAIMRAYDGREMMDRVVTHPLFDQYIIKRTRELLAKKVLQKPARRK